MGDGMSKCENLAYRLFLCSLQDYLFAGRFLKNSLERF